MKSKQKKHQVKELDTLLNVFTPTGFEHRKYCNIRTMTGGGGTALCLTMWFRPGVYVSRSYTDTYFLSISVLTSYISLSRHI